MANSRIHNTKRNIFWGASNKIVNILLPFVTRTVLIYVLGIEYVGISGLFGSILQVLSLADLGFASAIVFSMYKPLSENDINAVGALLGYYKKIYRVIGSIILICGLSLTFFLRHLITGSYPVSINIYIIYVLYLLNTSLSYFLFAYKKSLLIASQRKDVSDNINSLIRILLCVFQIISLIAWRNYYVYTVLIPLMTIVDNLLCHIMTTKLYPEYVCNDRLPESAKGDIIEKTKGLFIYKVCGVTRNSLDNIFISMFLGLTPVGIYSNYYYIMNSVKGFMDVLTTGMSASIGNSVATESVEKNYNNLTVLTFSFQWICGWCTVCMLCLYQPFMELWIGRKGMLDFSVVIALCIYFYVWTAGDIRSQYSDASGLWWKEKWRSLAETLGNIIMNYCFVRWWGVLGIVLATATSILFIGLPWSTKIVFTNYFKGYSWCQYLLKQLFYSIVTVGACLITYGICSRLKHDGITLIILRGLICLIIPNLYYFVVFSRSYVFKQSIHFIKNIVNSR